MTRKLSPTDQPPGRAKAKRLARLLGACLAAALANTTVSAEVPGQARVEAAFVHLPQQERLEVTLTVAASDAEIRAVGELNATRDAVNAVIAGAHTLSIVGAGRVVLTRLVRVNVTLTELRNLVSSLPEVERVDILAGERIDLNTAVPAIRGDQAHLAGATGRGQVVVVLDTGVDPNAFDEDGNHFFGSRVIDGACFSGGRTGSTTACPDGSLVQTGLEAGTNCNVETYGDCFHGTFVSAIAVGNAGDLVGAAPEAELIPIQVFSKLPKGDSACADTDEDPCINESVSDVLAALEYVRDVLALRYPVVAVNMSIGGKQKIADTCPNDPRETAIYDLRSMGIAVIASSGNDGWKDGIHAPACAPSSIAVGATYDWDQIWNQSNSSKRVDLLAPGAHIYSARPGGQPGESSSGTSYAAPLVAGAFAALQGYLKADVDTLLHILANSGTQVDTLAVPRVSRPKIDLKAAVDALTLTRSRGPSVVLRDTWRDTGQQPDANSATSAVNESPSIWVSPTGNCSTRPVSPPNPAAGSANFVCVRVSNDGKTAATGWVNVYAAPLNVDSQAKWLPAAVTKVTVPPGKEAVVRVPWPYGAALAPSSLLAHWSAEEGTKLPPLHRGIALTVRSDRTLAWNSDAYIDVGTTPTQSSLHFEPAAGRKIGLGVTVQNLDPALVGPQGKLVIKLPSDPGDLAPLDPAARYYLQQGATITIPLEPGYYAIPNITLPDNQAADIPLTFDVNSSVTGRGEKLRIRVVSAPELSGYKAEGNVANVPMVTYILRK